MPVDPESTAPPRPTQAARLPRRIYVPRTVGLGLGALCAGAGLQQAGAPTWAWAVMLTYCAAWPHVAYQIASRAADPGSAERRNVLFDSLAGGFWVVAMAFNVLPSVLLLAALAMNNLGVGGGRLFRQGLGAMAFGVGAGMATLGLDFQPETHFVTVLWCLPFLLSYPMVLGHVTYRLAIELSQRKNELRHEKRRADEASAAQARVLADLAARDGLTNLYNRRYMAELLAQQRLACERHGKVFSVALADLDHFKRINDTHGHAVGDQVLRTFTQLCLGVVRGSDAVGRWGGEEFILVFPGATSHEARQATERLREQVAAAKVNTPGADPLAFSVSIGLAEYHAPESVDALVERADRAMYQAKQQGRNRVVSG